MSRISPDFGGPLVAQRGGFISSILHRLLQRHPDKNNAGLSALLGWPAETFQNYRDGKHSPTIDRVAVTLARRTTPADFVLDTLQSLAGRRLCVVLFVDVARRDPPWMYFAASLLSTMVAFHIGWWGRGRAEREGSHRREN